MNQNYFYYIFFALLVAFQSCITPPDFSVVPEIEFISLSKDSLQQGTGLNDELNVQFSFKDGDGDIGSDSITLFITDLRDGSMFQSKQIPFLPSENAANGVEGTISFKLNTTCCIGEGSINCCQLGACDALLKEQNLIYEIYIEDRAKNKSNVIQTTPIILICNN